MDTTNSFYRWDYFYNQKYRLEGGDRYPNTMDLEEDLIKWVSEQRRLEIGKTTSEIIISTILFWKDIHMELELLHIWPKS